MVRWYLSFAGERGWLGGAVVRARSFKTAIQIAHVLRINPGGSVMGAELEPDVVVPDECMFTLLTKEGLAAIGRANGDDSGAAPWQPWGDGEPT